MELAGKTLGIIGYGALGQGMQRAAEALGMQVWISARDATDLRPGRVPRAMLLAQSDVVSLHCPLTPETRHLLDAAAFAMMKPGALVINTARGGLIEDVALAARAYEKALATGAGVKIPDLAG